MIGYARVSTTEQDTALQITAMRSAGIDIYFEEQASGVKARPQLERALALLQPGSTLVVYKIDRLARSLTDLLRIEEQIRQSGASLRSLTEPIETETPAGRMIFQLLGVLAQFERSVIIERCNAGRVSAKARGIKFGRERTFDYAETFRMRNEGLSVIEIAKRIGRSRATVNSAIKRMREGKAKISP